MRAPIELMIDVTEAAGLGVTAQTAVTVYLPEGKLPERRIVCFAFPGGGYCRRYFSFDMPGASGGGQAGFHTDKGWIFVACDHLGFGDSTVPEGNALTLDNVAAANHATVIEVMKRLETGALADGLGPVTPALKLGIGQSMGGCFTIVAQGQLGTFDAVGLLGYSAIHTVVPTRPGRPQPAWPWISRQSSLDAPMILNAAAMAGAETVGLAPPEPGGENPFQWSFHYDDEPPEIVAMDMAPPSPGAPLAEWRSATTPPCGAYMVAPGVVALEAAAITVPVLVAVGERDVVPDPWAEPKAFKSSADVSVFVCPRMGHMHNFAGTRRLFWQRIHSWGEGVAAQRNAG
ncbi:MAG: hypothetical protein JWQ29_2462 [Phenylobacterium sp.]|nr:hypothetical protein [Phenylobacterium sp.]